MMLSKRAIPFRTIVLIYSITIAFGKSIPTYSMTLDNPEIPVQVEKELLKRCDKALRSCDQALEDQLKVVERQKMLLDKQAEEMTQLKENSESPLKKAVVWFLVGVAVTATVGVAVAPAVGVGVGILFH